MGTPYLGGWKFTTLKWSGAATLRAEFEAIGWTDRLFQIYVGRSLQGCTRVSTDRVVEFSVPVSGSPIALVVVEHDDRNTDFGHLLCWRPWNTYCVTWEAPAVITDLKHFDVVVSSVVDQPYDVDNVVGRVPYDAAKTSYQFNVPAFGESGDWQVAVIPRDDASPLGNAGTAQSLTLPVVVYPKDLALDPNGDRFTVAVATGNLAADFTY